MKSQGGMSGFFLSERGLPLLAAFLGALLASWMILQAHGSINPDGIMYVEIARLFSVGDWSEGLRIYNWPLYPLLIMLVHSVSGLSFQSSAHVLAVFAFAATSGGLVVLVREVGGDRRTILAAMLLLLVSPYMVGTVLPMVVRDQLFWAMHIWSLVFFLRFYHKPAWREALGWGSAAILAVLFRIEALIYLLLLPLVILTDRGRSLRDRLIHLVIANCLPIMVMVMVIAATIFAFYPSMGLEHLGRLSDPVSEVALVYDQFAHGLGEKSRIYAENILGNFLEEYALSGLLLTLAYVVLIKSVSSAGWLQLGVALLGRSTATKVRKPQFNSVFCWLIMLGLVNAVFIILAHFLLPMRYLMPIAFVILLYAAFGLHAFYESWLTRSSKSGVVKWGFPLLILMFMVQLIVIVWPSDQKKMPMLQAAQWISSHVAPDSRIYYDSRRLRYYATGDSSDRTKDEWPTVQRYFGTDMIRQFDYMVVSISRKTPERENYLTWQAGAPPIATFDNGRGDKVLIYQVSR